MKKTKWYTMNDIAEANNLSYDSIYRLFKEKSTRLPLPKVIVNSIHCYWDFLPKIERRKPK